MRIFFLPLFFLFSGVAYSQDPVYRNISNLNGLPSNTVYTMLQDKVGYIWIAHDKGLCRYDGKIFKQYKGNNNQGRSLSNLLEIDDAIWCQDFSGNFFYTKQDSLATVPNFKTLGVYSPAGIINTNTIASINPKTITTYNVKTTQVQNFPFSGEVATGIVYQENKILFISNDSLYAFNGKDVKPIEKLKLNVRIFFLQQFGKNLLAFTKNTSPYVYRLQKTNAEPLAILPKELFIQDVNVINDELWVCTTNGAYCFNKEMLPMYGGHCFFKGTSVTKVLKDREGNYWFSSINRGINIVPNIDAILYPYTGEAITTLTNTTNGLLLGTDNNRLLHFSEKNEYTSLFKRQNNHEIINILNDEEKGNILLCTDELVLISNKKNIRSEQLASKSICIINNKLYGVAYGSGLALMNRSTNGISEIPTWLQTKKATTSSTMYKYENINYRSRWVLFNKVSNTFYGATTGGLFYFNPKKSGKILLKGKDIYAAQIIQDGNSIYAATYNNGLVEITHDTVAKCLYKSEQNSTIYKLYKSGDWIWLIGDEQLQKYNITTKEVVNYATANGLPKAEIKDIIVKNGKAYIATTLGLVVFKELAEKNAKVPPALVLNGVWVNKNIVDSSKLLSLTSTENNLTIKFSVLSFKGEDVQAIQYKINNDTWQNIDASSRELSLPALSSGQYQIQIQAINYRGIKAAIPLSIYTNIGAPFYKKWWFYLAIMLLGMALVYTYFKIKLRTEKRNSDLLAQKVQLEQALQQSMLASIKSQMNPHFLFNALNTIQSYIYTNNKEFAAEYLGKFSALTRMILDMSSKDIITLSDEIKALRLYVDLEAQRFRDKLNYSIIIENNFTTDTIYIPSMLIQPYVENAIKHGLLHSKNKWLLTISIQKDTEGIIVVIDDNGIGRKKSEALQKNIATKHKSFATTANQKRLEILNKGLTKIISLQIMDKQDSYGNATGTKVQLHIPYEVKSFL